MRSPSCRAQERQTYDKINSRPNRRAWMPAHWPLRGPILCCLLQMAHRRPDRKLAAIRGAMICANISRQSAQRRVPIPIKQLWRKLSASLRGSTGCIHRGTSLCAGAFGCQKWAIFEDAAQPVADVEFSWIRNILRARLAWGLLGFG